MGEERNITKQKGHRGKRKMLVMEPVLVHQIA
jgi:hypothetical protein